MIIKCFFFSIYFQNCRGLRTKLNTFYENTLCSNYSAIAVCENWLTSSHKDSEIFDDRYIVFRSDRNLNTSGKKSGGGCLLAIKKDFRVQQLPSIDIDVDCVVVKIVIDNITSIFVCVTYFSPDTHSATYLHFFDYIYSTVQPESNLILIGDYNLPQISGVNFDFLNSRNTCSELYNLMCFYSLKTLNNIINKNNRTLDLVLANVNDIVVTREQQPLVPVDAHHPPVTNSVPIFKTD